MRKPRYNARTPDANSNSTLMRSTSTSFSTARIESLSVRRKTATIQTILIKYTITRFSARFFEFYCGTCYGAYGAEILEHSCAIMLKRRLLEYARILISGLPELQNHNNGDVILQPHMSYEPFDISALSEVRAKINSSSPLSNGAGLTGLAQRTRVLQRQHGIPRASDQENDISTFNFS